MARPLSATLFTNLLVDMYSIVFLLITLLYQTSWTMHHLSSAACQTLVTKKLYSAHPEFVGWSDTICDPHVPLRLCMSAVLTISRHMSPTVLTKTLYSAFSDSVSPSDRLCDYTGIWDSRHVGWADSQPIYVNVFTKILIDIYSIILLLSTLLYLAS